MKRVPFNINHFVLVKLTDVGREELRRQHLELHESLRSPGYDGVPAETDGWSRWQLWDLMHRLGPLCVMGLTGPFETKIEFEVTL